MRPVPAAIAGLSLLALACAAPSPKGAPLVVTDMKLGTLKRQGSDVVLDQERTRLPRVAGSSGDLDRTFGVCFTATGGERPGTLTIEVTPPTRITETELRRVGESVQVSVDLPPSGQRTCQELYFDASDPTGAWRFELKDGATILHTWDIDVFEP